MRRHQVSRPEGYTRAGGLVALAYAGTFAVVAMHDARIRAAAVQVQP